jgi:hypothetical protein
MSIHQLQHHVVVLLLILGVLVMPQGSSVPARRLQGGGAVIPDSNSSTSTNTTTTTTNSTRSQPPDGYIATVLTYESTVYTNLLDQLTVVTSEVEAFLGQKSNPVEGGSVSPIFIQYLESSVLATSTYICYIDVKCIL